MNAITIKAVQHLSHAEKAQAELTTGAVMSMRTMQSGAGQGHHTARVLLGLLLIGSVTTAWSATTQVRERVYDALGHLSLERDAQGQVTTYTYDNNGNRLTATDPLNHTTTNAYDALNRLKQVTDPGNGITRYQYDGADHLTQVTDPRGLVTSYSYDGLGNLLQLTSPDTGVTSYVYDNAGNLITRTDARNVTSTYTYDALNRLTQINYGDQTVTYQYDTGANGIGRLAQMTDGGGWTQWSYDSLGRVVQKTQATSGTQALIQSMGYSYDSQGHLAQITYPSGHVLQYSYAQGLAIALSLDGQTVVTGVHYQPFGGPESWSWGNGASYDRAYDLNGRLALYPMGNASRVLTYDAAGRISALTDPVTAANNQNYGYDNLDRLTAANLGSSSYGYSYDANGNRTSLTGSSSASYTYASSSNRLTAIGSASRTYDNAGNLTNDGTRTLTYNNAGRLSQVTTGTNTDYYKFNGKGERVLKSGNDVATGNNRYLYDESGKLLGDYDSLGLANQETIYLGTIPVAVVKGNTLYYIHTDQLNAPRAITASAGTTNTILWRWDGEPFGNTPPNDDVDNDGNHFIYNARFPGQYYDKETNLHYNYFRDYDPSTGRYVQSDPIGLEGESFSTYAYVSNNPLWLIDPEGLLETVPPIDPNNPQLDPKNPPQPKPPGGIPQKPVPQTPRPVPPKPGEKRVFCQKLFERCVAFCRSPACPSQALVKGGCVAGCFSAAIICNLIH